MNTGGSRVRNTSETCIHIYFYFFVIVLACFDKDVHPVDCPTRCVLLLMNHTQHTVYCLKTFGPRGLVIIRPVIQGCWKVLSPTRKETSYSDRRFWCSYFLFIIIIGGILVLFIYITRLQWRVLMDGEVKWSEVNWSEDHVKIGVQYLLSDNIRN
jgi:hypothetical protein